VDAYQGTGSSTTAPDRTGNIRHSQVVTATIIALSVPKRRARNKLRRRGFRGLRPCDMRRAAWRNDHPSVCYTMRLIACNHDGPGEHHRTIVLG